MKKEREMRTEEKLEGGEIVVQSGFAKWFDNFWYHYKWHAIGALVAILVLLVGTLSMCSRKKEDMTLVYAGPVVLSISELEQISAVIEELMPYDIDNDGEKETAWMAYQIYSEAQIKALLEEKDAEGKPVNNVNRSYNVEQYKTYGDYLMTGASSVYLLDPWLYAELLEADRLAPLPATVSQKGTDGYGVRLGDTDLYESYGVLQLLPADTMICLMRPFEGTPWAKSNDKEQYQFEKDVFVNMVSFANKDD